MKNHGIKVLVGNDDREMGGVRALRSEHEIDQMIIQTQDKLIQALEDRLAMAGVRHEGKPHALPIS